MKVLLSIRPNFCGEKNYEYRRAIFKQDVDTIVVYSTSPEGKIVGEFEVEEIIHDTVENLWNVTRDSSGTSKAFFLQYFHDKKKGYAIKIGRRLLYESPIDPKTSNSQFRAPQSFCYVE